MLTKAQLKTVPTPSGHSIPKALAKRLKKQTILKLVREDLKCIERYHPAVLHQFNALDLAVMERRALVQVIEAPILAWRSKLKQSTVNDAVLVQKIEWYEQLVDSLMLSRKTFDVVALKRHMIKTWALNADSPASAPGNPWTSGSLLQIWRLAEWW